jgi:hypothetical protein
MTAGSNIVDAGQAFQAAECAQLFLLSSIMQNIDDGYWKREVPAIIFIQVFHRILD